MTAEELVKIERLGNVAAEDGDPDVLQLAQRALDGDAAAVSEALEVWQLWDDQGRFAS